MTAEHCWKLTLHVASNVWVSRTRERVVVKKELEVCSSKENGKHSLKVSLARKLLKNCGHDGEVKLFPRLVSNGLGSGVSPSGVADTMPVFPVEVGPEISDAVGAMLDGRLEDASCLA